MKTWFISDLHLDPKHPVIAQQFLTLLAGLRGQASSLYILGDLFEYWIGDDVLDTPLGAGLLPIVNALKATIDSGISVSFQHGNRDFLISKHFAELAGGVSILPEQYVINLYGTPTLLMHGDSLCTDDVEYQHIRQLFRDPQWQAQSLALSIPERIQKAQAIREQSRVKHQEKSEYITDVNQQAVEQAMLKAGVKHLIHGHTHRPATHEFSLEGQTAKRIVLGDWSEQRASYLTVDAQCWQLVY